MPLEIIIDLVIYVGIPVVLLLLGFIAGSAIESNHFASLKRREAELSGIMMSDLKRLPPNWEPTNPQIVAGCACIATDYFKTFVAYLRGLFGGEIKNLNSLVERARREAVVRMLEEARDAGANIVWNVRIETMVVQSSQQNQSAGVEVLAYGTAMRV